MRDGFWQRGPLATGLAAAFAAGVLAMALRAVVHPLLGDDLPFIFLFPALVFVTLRHGVAPALLTILVGAVWVAVPHLPPSIAREHLLAGFGGFAFAAVLTCLVCAQFATRQSFADEPLAPNVEAPLSRWLRSVIWGVAGVSLIAFAGVCWWSFQQAFAEGRASVVHNNGVVAQHAQRSFALASELAELAKQITGVPDAELRASEAKFHTRLRDITVGQPAVLAVTVIDRTGRVLVSSGRFPVDVTLDMTDRDYFKQHRASAQSSLRISGLLEDRPTGQPAFNVTVRRNGPNGEFNGVTAVSLLPQYFQRFYESLSSQVRGQNTYLLLLEDGSLLTRWPPPAEGTERMPARNALTPVLQQGRPSGVVELTSSFDNERRIVSYQRIGDLPVYVTAGLSETTVLAGWYLFIWMLSAFLLPATIGLAYVSWLAMQRTRRYERLWWQLQGEMERRLQAEGALLQSQKLEALGQLTGGVAHDFNNLLGIVSNSVFLLQRLHPELASTQPLGAIARATASGVKLTRQLLSFARKHTLNPETVRLQQWLPAAGDLLRTTLGSRIALSIEVDPDVAPIQVDASELEVALINLVVNAKHAMADGGSVRIVAVGLDVPAPGDPQPGVLLQVIDSGSGIPADVIGRVFEPFFTTKGPGQGSGLGLSQVYGLCVQAGGNARVASQVGRGTTVSMVFPALARAAQATNSAAPALAARLHGRVLMVEDNPDLAVAQEALLRSVGLQVQCASQADIAAEMAERDAEGYDVVLSDVMMPGPMSGIDLAFRLRRTRPELPVILLTGYADQIEKATQAGFVVLGKPTEPGILFAQLNRAMHAPRPHSAQPPPAAQPQASQAPLERGRA